MSGALPSIRHLFFSGGARAHASARRGDIGRARTRTERVHRPTSAHHRGSRGASGYSRTMSDSGGRRTLGMRWDRPPPGTAVREFFEIWLPSAYMATARRATANAPRVRITIAGNAGGGWDLRPEGE